MESFAYDCYCTNSACISKDNAFFNFAFDNEHVLEHPENVKAIHPLILQKMMQGHNQQKFEEEYREMIAEKMKNAIENVNKHITDFLNRKFYATFGEELEKKFQNSNKLDICSLAEHLKAGDMNLVKKIERFQSQQTGISFENFMRMSDSQKISTQIHQQIANFSQKVVQILDVAFDNTEELLSLNNDYLKFNLNKQSPTTIGDGKRLRKNITKIDYSQSDFEYDGFDSSFQFTSNNTSQKTKNIAKQRANRKSQNHKKPQKRINIKREVQKDAPLSRELEIISEKQIIIHKCTHPMKTFQYIADNFRNLTTFHIFSSRFACKEIIRKLFKHFKDIEVLTFNCNHEFESELLSELTDEQLENIKTLELKWGIRQFFKEYYLMHGFPTKIWRHFERIKKIKISPDNFKQMPKNDTLWLESDEHVDAMKFIKLNRIKVLHFATAAFEKMASVKKLIEIQSITNLVVLNIRGLSFADGENNFNTFVSRNVNLTTVIIYQCEFMASNISQTLRCLKLLPYLTNFFFTPNGSYAVIESTVITGLHNVESLHLSKINFSDSQGYANSACLKDLFNLKKLKRLELYACNPVFTDLFNYLHDDVFPNIELLNIGFTQVDTLLINYLIKMPKLQYLNIDSIKFFGNAFLEHCRLYLKQYGKKWPLKYLSIEEMPGQVEFYRFTLETLKELGEYLPELVYIYVNGCNNLKGYRFEEFPKLETVGLGKELNRYMDNKVSFNRYVV